MQRIVLHNILNLRESPYFYLVTDEEAETLLKGKPAGTALIKNCPYDYLYILELKIVDHQGEILSFPIPIFTGEGTGQEIKKFNKHLALDGDLIPITLQDLVGYPLTDSPQSFEDTLKHISQDLQKKFPDLGLLDINFLSRSIEIQLLENMVSTTQKYNYRLKIFSYPLSFESLAARQQPTGDPRIWSGRSIIERALPPPPGLVSSDVCLTGISCNHLRYFDELIYYKNESSCLTIADMKSFLLFLQKNFDLRDEKNRGAALKMLCKALTFLPLIKLSLAAKNWELPVPPELNDHILSFLTGYSDNNFPFFKSVITRTSEVTEKKGFEGFLEKAKNAKKKNVLCSALPAIPLIPLLTVAKKWEFPLPEDLQNHILSFLTGYSDSNFAFFKSVTMNTSEATEKKGFERFSEKVQNAKKKNV